MDGKIVLLAQLSRFFTKIKALFATKDDVTSATEGMVTETTLAAKGYQTATEVENAITAKGYDTTTGSQDKADAALTAAKSYADGLASNYDAAGAADDALASAKNYTDTAVSSTYRYKGSVAFASLPSVSSAKGGDVYNITDDFTTTDDFIEGSGKSYPAGTNVARVTGTVKWDVLAGSIDLSAYVESADLVACTNDDIDALFS